MQTADANALPNAGASEFSKTVSGRAMLGLAATAVVAAAAHVSVPLWFTPVPLTLQPLAVLGVGLALGPMTGFLAMAAYLCEGALGLPVFAPTGPGGIAQILGPTGGFLMAYPVVAAIAGGMTRWLQMLAPKFLSAVIACTAAVVVLFLCGASWLMHFGHSSVQQAWIAGVAPFLPGEAIKILIASGIYSATARPARG